MNLNYTDEEIEKAMKRYISQKATANAYYKNKYATDEAFRENHKEKSKEYYHKHKEEIKAKYHLEKKYKQSLRKYNYYKEKNELDKYKKLYPEEWESYFKDKE